MQNLIGNLYRNEIICIACHDAGAANNIIFWAKNSHNIECVRPYLLGPAKKIWELIYPGIPVINSLEEVGSSISALVVGTGWQTDFEYQALEYGISSKIRTVSVLDHWVNYEERFIRGDKELYPKEIWTFDNQAYKIARNLFGDKNIEIYQLHNYYLQELIRKVRPIDRNKRPELLYVLEPIVPKWSKFRLHEYEALDYFVVNMKNLNLPENILIRFKPHPSEAPGKYAAWIERQNNANFILDESIDLAEGISRASWVVGCQSFAMVVALFAGREVICTLPPHALNHSLPFNEIKYLYDK